MSIFLNFQQGNIPIGILSADTLSLDFRGYRHIEVKIKLKFVIIDAPRHHFIGGDSAQYGSGIHNTSKLYPFPLQYSSALGKAYSSRSKAFRLS